MPRGDGTGPGGMGPMTGRAAGFCAGYPVPGYMNPAGGAGWVNPIGGRGYRGGGRGWARAGYGYPAWGPAVSPYATYAGPVAPTVTAPQELDALRQQAEYFQDTLDEVNKRIDELEAESKKK